jgi:hypothetical protein
MSVCTWPQEIEDAQGCIPISYMINSLGDCQFPSDRTVCFSTQISPVNEKGEIVKEEIPERKVKKMEKTELASNDPIVLASATMTQPPVLGVTTATTKATVSVQDNAIADIKALIPADGNITGGTVAMAVVGLAGSGAVIKIVKSFLDGKQEQAMKKLEMEEKKEEPEEDEHGNCEVDRAALSAKLEIMATKLDELVAKLDGSLEAIETMEGELAKIQQKLVALEVSDKKAVAKKPAKAAKKAK